MRHVIGTEGLKKENGSMKLHKLFGLAVAAAVLSITFSFKSMEAKAAAHTKPNMPVRTIASHSNRVKTADCPVTLDAKDTYREVTIKFDCLQRRINDLEQKLRRLSKADGVSPTQRFPKLKGCLDVMPGDKKRVTFVLKSGVRQNICWEDGVLFLVFKDVAHGRLRMSIPGVAWRFCDYNTDCPFDKSPDTDIHAYVKKLLPEGRRRRAKITLKLSPK